MENKKFELQELKYNSDALEPVISKETIELHWGKHLATYVNNLNNLIEGTKYEGLTLEQICVDSEGGIFNNAAQIWNHNFYFETFSPSGNRQPSGKLSEEINNTFGSFDAFKEVMEKAGATLFGSGWVWLSKNSEGKLEITQESNAGNPLAKGYTPLLVIDVWEHAYYVDCRNRRADHLKAIWEIIDWTVVEGRYNQ